ncbi:MAG: radical SAM protein [Candidatus Aminicenantes bacterium]|nr:radical SAM protein [Candidatus Aminicenantes bacterium]
MLLIREVQAKSILNRSKIHPYCLNPYTGCEVGCAYCYARLFIPRYSGHIEPWGSFVDVKVNAPDLLRRQLRRARPETVWVSSVCDPYQPSEARYGLTRRCLEELLRCQMPVQIQTKSALALRDLDLFARFQEITVGFTVTTDDEGMRQLFEPHASPILERIEALRELHRRGIPTFAFIGPLIPADPERLAALLAGHVDHVLIDRLNYVPAVRPFYARHGLEPFLRESFFAAQKVLLATALGRRGLDFEMLF